MVKILEAKLSATVVLDSATGKPCIIVVDPQPSEKYPNPLDDPAFWQYRPDVKREDVFQVDVPVDVYNDSIKNPAGVHLKAVEFAQQQAGKIPVDSRPPHPTSEEQQQTALDTLSTEKLQSIVPFILKDDPFLPKLMAELERRK